MSEEAVAVWVGGGVHVVYVGGYQIFPGRAILGDSGYLRMSVEGMSKGDSNLIG